MLENIFLGIKSLASIKNFFYMVFGTGTGITIGAIPGLTGTMAVALLVPVTFVLSPITGLAMLAGIYNGAIYGGSISAILLRIPGTPAGCVTIFDGFEMTKKGESALALEAAISSSVCGGLISVIVLLLVAPPLARIALMFGPAEYFWVAVFGLTIIVSLSPGSIIKGMISGFMGLFFAVIGLDPLTAFPRFTFSSPNLLGGVDLISVLIGLFALPQAFCLMEQVRKGDLQVSQVSQDNKRAKLFGLFPKLWRTYIRSSIIGTVVGIIPAAGGNIASFIGYDQAKRWSSEGHKFGTGIPEGVVASEAANNGITGGSFVPLLTLGIPGSTTTAAIMGAFLIHGLNLGPQLFTKHPEIVYSLIVALFFTNIIMLFMGYYCSTFFTKILKIPNVILSPLIIVFSVVGSYAMRSNLFDVFMLFFFGVLGYFMEKLDYPLAPLVLGLILGPLAEANLQRALTISQGSVGGLFNSFISFLFIALSLISLIGSLRKNVLMEKITGAPQEPGIDGKLT